MAHNVIYDQSAPGGPHKQICTIAGINPASLNQYALGGVAEQMRVGVNPSIVYNQYAPGGCSEQIRVATNALP